MNYDLIIYDCDGTLVNTEHVLNCVFIAAIRRLAPEPFHQFDVKYVLTNCIGKTVPEIFDQMEKDTGLGLSPFLRTNIIASYQSRLPEELAAFLQPDPELIGVLNELSLHFQMCVASNGLAKTVGMSLAAAGLSNIFNQNVFAAEYVAKGKPAPDLIFYAAEKMGISNMSRILHIEDTFRGAKAGIAASVNVIGYTGHTTHKAKAAMEMRDVGVIEVFDNWTDIAAFAMR